MHSYLVANHLRSSGLHECESVHEIYGQDGHEYGHLSGSYVGYFAGNAGQQTIIGLSSLEETPNRHVWHVLISLVFDVSPCLRRYQIPQNSQGGELCSELGPATASGIRLTNSMPSSKRPKSSELGDGLA